MTNLQLDTVYLKQTLELAKIRRGFCAPNPSVGAVIVKDDTVLATGYHMASGLSHAEVDALQKINHKAQGATAYVSLEPCCHFGKTPPCTAALIQAGIKRVVFGFSDPNPLVADKGKASLIAAGIACDYLELKEINDFYESYYHWHKTKRPFVTAKLALTLDGKIAGPNGEPVAITSQDLNQLTHLSRKTSDAILTTAKTIIRDNPQMNARYQNEVIAKPIYILDSQLNLPLHSQIFKTAKPISVFHAKDAPIKNKENLLALGVRCVEIPVCPFEKGGVGGILNLHQVLDSIGQDGIHDLWIETGPTCFTAFVEQKLVQRGLIYIAPWSLPNGTPAFQAQLDLRSHKINWHQHGKDVLCEIRW